MDLETLAALAARQYGVFSRRQATELGFTRFMITRRIETKVWRRVIGSVLTAGTSRLEERALEWAAYLACGPNAVLSGPSALRRHGLDAFDGPTWVTIPAERHVKFSGIRTIREALPDADIVDIDGMRVTSLERSVIDTLRILPEYAGQPILDRALLRGWLTVDGLQVRCDEFDGRRGVARLRSHLKRVSTGARSEAERLLHRRLDDAGLTGWTADFKVFDADGVLVAVLDVAFTTEKVAVEVDGLAFHTDPARFQRDRTRQNLLVNDGWTVLRFTWDDLSQRRRHVVETIRAALQRTHR